jgi:hypothetical protein
MRTQEEVLGKLQILELVLWLQQSTKFGNYKLDNYPRLYQCGGHEQMLELSL